MTTRIEPAPRPSALARLASMPDAVLVLIVYLASRVLTTSLLGIAFGTVARTGISHIGTASGFLGFLQGWDGQFYRQVAETGYPTELPTDSSGNIAKNVWAFLPLYPLISRGFMSLGMGFSVAGPLVSTIFGGLAAVALFHLLRARFSRTQALWGAVLFCVGPMSYVLELSYAESTYLFFMFASLAAIIRKRYLIAMPFGVLASFSHPGALAIALVLGVAFLRERKPFALLSAAVVGVAGFAWPVIAGAVTHDPSGYINTELAWWSDYIGRVHFRPFQPWFIFAGHYWGTFGVLFVAAIVIWFLWWLARPSMREFGSDIRTYTFSYGAYLLAVFLPQQSLFRMLLPFSPLLGHSAFSRSQTRRIVSLAASIALQMLGILLFWVIWPP